MSRTAKKSDLEKKDLKDFSIGLTDARSLKITKDELKGIKEIIPNEKYKIRLTTGDRYSETFNGTLLEAIARKKELLKNENRTKEKNVSDDMMFMDAVSLFVDYCYEREKRGEMDLNSVFDHIKKINADISDFFYKYKLSEVDTPLIEKFIDTMRKRKNKSNPSQNLSEQTIANHLRTLSAILNYLVRKRILKYNPMDEVTNKPAYKKGKKELNYFQIDEAIFAIKCLDKFADIRLKTFMSVIFSLGCRREEASGLRWKDIDFKNNIVDFNYAITSSVSTKFLKSIGRFYEDDEVNTKNSNKERRVRSKSLKTDNSYRTNFISDSAISYLKKYYNFKIACGFDVSDDDYIFTSWKKNTPCDPNKLSEQWRNFKKEHGIKNVDLHRIRHTVANILEKKGVPKKDIAKMLGNTERVLEEYYTHVDVNDLKRLRNTLDEELYDNVEYINLNIDLIAKVINEYPMDSLNETELKTLDLISDNKIDSNNYLSCIKNIKDIILTSDGNLNYFMDDDENSLKIKLETYKRFSDDDIVKIKREKDISIKRDILSF